MELERGKEEEGKGKRMRERGRAFTLYGPLNKAYQLEQLRSRGGVGCATGKRGG